MVIEHKYKCPRCEFLTCSLPCIKVHKGETGCSGIKEKVVVGQSKLLVSDMTLPGLRQEMKFLEDGINLSNKAKKENTLARAGIAEGLVAKIVDPKALKKQKNLKAFLKKKRAIHYYLSPSSAFKRQSLNKTRIDSISKDATVFWTLQLKFIEITDDSKWFLRSSPVTDIILHEVPEKMTLSNLANTAFLNKQSEKSDQENFRMWITDEANKEAGGKYDWSSVQVALKKVTKQR